MSRVFLSYARADLERVAPLARALEKRGHEVWWDTLMEGGAAFARVIEERLEAADAVVVAWSATSVGSDWVRDEAGRGRDRACLVPVTLDGVAPPLGFRQYHCTNLSRWTGDPNAPEMNSIEAGLTRCAGLEAPALRPAVATRAPDRRVLLIGGGVAAVAAAAGGGWLWWRGGDAAADNSIAVLPFDNLSASPAQAYFADGLAEELRAALMRNPAVQVAAPTSSANARKMGDARSIASALGVAYLLMGSVRRQGEQVRIAAELIDGGAGFSKWSRQFDERLDDVFAVQRTIAAAVAEAVAARFDGRAADLGGTTDPRAFDAYLRGLALFHADSGEDNDRAALARLDEAVAADPRFARALAARARALSAIAVQYAKVEELRLLHDDAIATAGRAVAVAPGLAGAQLALGFARLTGRLDVAGAKPAYDAAARLGAGDADVLLLTAIYQARTRRDAEAVAGIGRALARDPLNPRAFRAASTIHLCGARYDEAIAAARQALRLAPTLANANAAIGAALLMTGRDADALQAYGQERNPVFRMAGLAIAQRRRGDAGAADATFAQMVREIGPASAFQQAQVLAQWGRADQAMAALATARRLGDAGLLGLVTDPLLTPLRPLPAFAGLARELGFPSAPA